LSWRIEFDAAAAKEFKALDRTVQERIRRFLRDRLLVAGWRVLPGNARSAEAAGVAWFQKNRWACGKATTVLGVREAVTRQ
jgi:hypothetical protein